MGCYPEAMLSRSLVLALLCCACTREPLAPSPPLITDAPPAPATKAPRAPVRSFETKTIGGDRYPLNRSPSEEAPAAADATNARVDPWAPTPQFGDKNPNPPTPGTPLYGDLNPSPPSTTTPRYGDLNPSPPGR